MMEVATLPQVLPFHLQCRGKIQYPNPAEALEEVHRLVRKQRVPFTIYICPYCNHWHVGRVPV